MKNNLLGTGSSLEDVDTTPYPLTNPIILANGNIISDTPLLSGLANHGGPMLPGDPTAPTPIPPGPAPTHALLAGSLAIDAGSNTLASDPLTSIAFTNDQRGTGFTRIFDVPGYHDSGAIVDIGAYELVNPLTVIGVTIDKTLGSVHPTYDVLGGSGEQIRTVPVGDANEIQIKFSENVTIAKLNLMLTSLRPGSGVTYDVSTSTFTYDSVNHIAKWTFPSAFVPDSILLTLSDAVTDAAGNALDGEWTNPIRLGQTGTSNFPSGNWIAGGAFNFRITILPGDANRDGRVTSADQDIVNMSIQNPPFMGAMFTTGDFNGDGVIDSADLAIVNTNLELYFLYVRGDWNLNQTLDSSDLGAMFSAFTDLNAFKATNHLTNDDLLAIGDLNNDGAVTNLDLQPLLDLLAGGSGSNEWSPWDLTYDGHANWDNAAILINHWGQTGCSPADGDLNCDGCVNQLDVDLLIANWTG